MTAAIRSGVWAAYVPGYMGAVLRRERGWWPDQLASYQERISPDAWLDALDDGHVGLAAALAHGLQPVPAAGPFQLAEQRAHQPGAGCPQRVAQRDGAAVGVDPGRVGAGLDQPGQHHAGEGLIDFHHV